MLLQINKSRGKNGFSLLEVIVFIAIFAVFFVTAAYIVTVALRSMKFNQNKLMASHLAREGMEWVRGEKEADWTSFTTRSADAGLAWCFNTDPILSWPSAGCSINDYSLKGRYKREIRLTSNGPSKTQVTAQVTVSWLEGVNLYSSPLSTVFSVYE